MPCTTRVTSDIPLGIGLMCQWERTLKGVCVTRSVPFFQANLIKYNAFSSKLCLPVRLACQTSLLSGSALPCLWLPFACVNLFLTPFCVFWFFFELLFCFPLSFLTINDSLTVFLCRLINVFWIVWFWYEHIYMILQTITIKILLCLYQILPIQREVKYFCLHIEIFTFFFLISATPATHWHFYYNWLIVSQCLVMVFLFVK